MLAIGLAHPFHLTFTVLGFVMKVSLSVSMRALLASLVVVAVAAPGAVAQVVPGTGTKIEKVGDDFEDPAWTYVHRLPKTYNLKDETQRSNGPRGVSKNGRWYEGPKRGQPDYIVRIDTPPNGLPGSTGALALQSIYTGIKNRPSHQQQQDDFICDVAGRFGKIPVSRTPSVVTRVWFPPVEEWENRTGCHFALRIALETYPRPGRGGGLFGGPKSEGFDGIYWPGMFVDFESKDGKRATGKESDYAHIRIRSTNRGREYKGIQIDKTGWWTLGMSITPDGQVHYYAKAGIEDLTEEDHLGSHHPYGYRALRFRTFFFNVCNGDDNKTWSTRTIVDDPSVYVLK